MKNIRLLIAILAVPLIAACANNPIQTNKFDAVGGAIDISPTRDTYRGALGAIASVQFSVPQESGGEVLSSSNKTLDGAGNVIAESVDSRSAMAVTDSGGVLGFGGVDAEIDSKLYGVSAVGAAADRLALWWACIEGVTAGTDACEILAANGRYREEAKALAEAYANAPPPDGGGS